MSEPLEMIEVNPVKDFTLSNNDRNQLDNFFLQIQDDLNAYYQINATKVALESYRNMLLETKACCKDDVINLMSLGISQESFPNINSFTSAKSPTNQKNLVSVITGTLVNLGNKLWDLLVSLFEKVSAFFSSKFDKQTGLTKNLELLRKNADKLTNGLNKMVNEKHVFDQLSKLHSEDLATVRKRVQLHLESIEVTNYDLTNISNKSLLGLYSELIDLAIQSKSNGLVLDAITTKEVIITLEKFTDIDLSNYILEFNSFIETEKPDKPLTRKYNTNIDFFFNTKYIGIIKERVSQYCNTVDSLVLSKPTISLPKYSFKDKAGLTFLSVFSQNIFKRTYNKKHLDSATKLIRSKFHPQTGWLASEMHPDYHKTLMEFYENLSAFFELTRRVEDYHNTLVNLVTTVNRTLEFQADLANYLNPKY